MRVYAFDRDFTVDVNPHPDRPAVPLAWVRHLAHETDHEVWAIGNQDLTHEAEIPGMDDLRRRLADGRDANPDDGATGARVDEWPERRERLRLLERLFPDADGYVVVDDADLSDVDGWTHYHAWDFVEAAESGRLSPDLPRR